MQGGERSKRWRRRVGFALVVGVAMTTSLHVACGRDAAKPTATEPDASEFPGRSPDAAPLADAEAALVDAAMLTDPAIWKAVPNELDCSIAEARVQPDPFPKRVWTSCGAGCRVADANLPIEKFGGVHSLTAGGGYVNGEVYLRLQLGFTLTALVDHVTRLSDGATVAAVAMTSDLEECKFWGVGDDPFQSTAVRMRSDGAIAWQLARLAPRSQSTNEWQTHALPVPAAVRGSFMLGSAHGYVSAREVGLLSSIDATEWLVRSEDAGYSRGWTGRNDLVAIGREDGDGGVIEGVSGDGGVSELARLGDVPLSLAMDDQRLAWVSAPGGVTGGTFPSTRMNWGPLVAGQLGSPSEGVPLATTPSVDYSALRVAGDIIATVGCQPNAPKCTLYVVNASLKKVWAIPGRPGAQFNRVIAVSPTEVVVSELDDPQLPPFGLMHRIVRLDIASLDTLPW